MPYGSQVYNSHSYQAQKPQTYRQNQDYDDDGSERLYHSRQDVGGEKPPHQREDQKHYDDMDYRRNVLLSRDCGGYGFLVEAVIPLAILISASS